MDNLGSAGGGVMRARNGVRYFSSSFFLLFPVC